MQDFDASTIKKIAKLAAIELTEEEMLGFADDLNKVLEHAKKLQEVDTQGIKPCDHVLEDMQISLREDIVKPHLLSSETFLANSPEHIGNMVKVPTVLD